jgi:hypothetical protein
VLQLGAGNRLLSQCDETLSSSSGLTIALRSVLTRNVSFCAIVTRYSNCHQITVAIKVLDRNVAVTPIIFWNTNRLLVRMTGRVMCCGCGISSAGSINLRRSLRLVISVWSD